MPDILPFVVSFKLAFFTVIILAVLSMPVALFFSLKNIPFKVLFESLLTLPMTLPPTVLGFYLLISLSPVSPFGSFIHSFTGIRLVFTFEGLLVASCIYSFPFMFQPLKQAIASLPKSYIEAALTLGKSNFEIFFLVILPNIRASLLAACMTVFSHTLGAFGVALMVGGNIRGVTKVASIALYEKVESLNYSQAHTYAIALLLISFVFHAGVHFAHEATRRRDLC